VIAGEHRVRGKYHYDVPDCGLDLEQHQPEDLRDWIWRVYVFIDRDTRRSIENCSYRPIDRENAALGV
jgi:hypothetical protein